MRVIPGNWLVVGGSSGSFFLCANGKEVEKKENERERAREGKRERGRHLYCIGLDAMMPVKLMSQLPREGRGQE